MISHYRFFLFIFALIISSLGASAFTLNQNGDFTVSVDSQNDVIPNTQLNTNFTITIKNNLDISQEIELDFEEVSGWDISTKDDSVELSPNETRTVLFNVEANNNLDYHQNAVSSDTIKIGRNEGYKGSQNFPVVLSSSQDNVSLVFQVEIIPESELKLSYVPRFSSQEISPVKQFGFSVDGKNITSQKDVIINVNIGENTYESIGASFDSQNNYKIFSIPIDSSLEPGTYQSTITIRDESTQGSAREWFKSQEIEVIEYRDIEVEEKNKNSILKNTWILNLTNNGNVDDEYREEINQTYFNSLFFTTNSDYESTSNGVELIVPLDSGETKEVSYSYNYIAIYLILIVIIFVTGYIAYRKSSNPFEVETKIYEVKRDKHEGIKSLKIRIGFENMKINQIDSLKVTFRMPAYLRVDDNSFLLSPPNNVYKGKSQYKLEWNFKKFEKNDSRILGFLLVNSKGILGDIRFGNLEFEVRVNGKTRKYYNSLPIVKG